MITRLHVKNFKCLLDVDVELGPFTVFIGPNDSGKSSLVEAIQSLGKSTRDTWEKVFAGSTSLENLVWRKDAKRQISWEIEGVAPGSSFRYRLGLLPGHKVPTEEWLTANNETTSLRMTNRTDASASADESAEAEVRFENRVRSLRLGQCHTALLIARHDPGTRFREFAEAFAATVKYSLDPKVLRNDQPPVPNPVLSPSGDNLVTVLDQVMTGPNRTARAELETAIHQNIPSIQGIALPASTTIGGAKSLAYILTGNGEGVTIPSALASDGLVLLTAFLALAYSDTPEIIFIEEPENGLHYSRLQKVIELLRKMSKGEVGFRPHQIIITTHSPLLLNFANPEEVRIFRRTAEGGTEVQSMAKVPDIDKLLQEFGTGELWYSLGEDALLKGVRP